MTATVTSIEQHGAHDTRFSVFKIIWDGGADEEVRIDGLPPVIQIYALLWGVRAGETAQPEIGTRPGLADVGTAAAPSDDATESPRWNTPTVEQAGSRSVYVRSGATDPSAYVELTIIVSNGPPLTASEIENDSGVIGDTVADALDNAGGGGGGPPWSVVTEGTATRTAAADEFVLINNPACVVTLPAPAANARVACKIITGTITSIEIRTSGAGVEIDGTDYSSTGLPLASPWEQISLRYPMRRRRASSCSARQRLPHTCATSTRMGPHRRPTSSWSRRTSAPAYRPRS